MGLFLSPRYIRSLTYGLESLSLSLSFIPFLGFNIALYVFPRSDVFWPNILYQKLPELTSLGKQHVTLSHHLSVLGNSTVQSPKLVV